MAFEIRLFNHKDLRQLQAIFEKNVPRFFAPHELAEYLDYMAKYPSNYYVMEYEGTLSVAPDIV